MKKYNLGILAGVIALAFTCGTADAAHVHVNTQHTPITHVHGAPQVRHVAHGGPHHHMPPPPPSHHHHHHYHHHNNTAGSVILATAILISAFM